MKIICQNCHEEKEHWAKGLCVACYNWHTKSDEEKKKIILRQTEHRKARKTCFSLENELVDQLRQFCDEKGIPVTQGIRYAIILLLEANMIGDCIVYEKLKSIPHRKSRKFHWQQG